LREPVVQEKDKLRAAAQETHLLAHNTLLTDEEADQQLVCSMSSL